MDVYYRNLKLNADQVPLSHFIYIIKLNPCMDRDLEIDRLEKSFIVLI